MWGWWNTAGLGLRGGCLDPKPASAPWQFLGNSVVLFCGFGSQKLVSSSWNRASWLPTVRLSLRLRFHHRIFCFFLFLFLFLFLFFSAPQTAASDETHTTPPQTRQACSRPPFETRSGALEYSLPQNETQSRNESVVLLTEGKYVRD